MVFFDDDGDGDKDADEEEEGVEDGGEAQKAQATSSSSTTTSMCFEPSCGAQEEGQGRARFSVCSSCGDAKYCSRACQKKHWKEHRHICMKRHSPKHEAETKEYGEAKAKNRYIPPERTFYAPSFEINTNLFSNGDGLPMITSCMQSFSVAFMEFSRCGGAGWKAVFEGEPKYLAFYRSLCDHESIWFDPTIGLFSSDKNMVYAERSVGILGTFATICRRDNRRDLCQQILDVDERVLTIYKAMAKRDGKHDTLVCCNGLEYKKNCIALNLVIDRFAEKEIDSVEFRTRAAKIQRELMYYEINSRFSFDEQQFVFLLRRGAGFRKIRDELIRQGKLKSREDADSFEINDRRVSVSTWKRLLDETSDEELADHTQFSRECNSNRGISKEQATSRGRYKFD